MIKQIIDGKATALQLCEELKQEIITLKKETGIQPGLATVLVGGDPASQVYVRMKNKKCEDLGIYSRQIHLEKDIPQEQLLQTINKLNKDPKIHGILVQMPLPKHLNERNVIENILPEKDVDCFHPQNVGKILIGDQDGFFPCTPNGIVELLKRYEIKTSGKNVVIIGRSNIVGKPLAVMLMQKAEFANATVTVVHSRTKNIPSITRNADILIAAMGMPEFVKADMVSEDTVVIDVGVNRVDAPEKKRGYKLVGDVAFDEVAPKTAAITPVPGGVGPMTIAMLMYNVVKAAKNR
ncbi:MAG: bifunctional methylenetetrahydrofolate dehydrogenase/methenyltetrahydrofolate cyclohydrolase FolD [Verrucomicrobiota bacterium]|nr:bifunctional methylenetetrahydrofolate dehydrogenase/methenyltetrahydrofolate cyclohydrolase FolD [Verrucomicrobiota bacterium]